MILLSFLKDEMQIKKFINCLNLFSKVTGLTLNIKKCTRFPLKDGNIHSAEIESIPVKGEVTYLE